MRDLAGEVGNAVGAGSGVVEVGGVGVRSVWDVCAMRGRSVNLTACQTAPPPMISSKIPAAISHFGTDLFRGKAMDGVNWGAPAGADRRTEEAFSARSLTKAVALS